jgi:hypothetical protein
MANGRRGRPSPETSQILFLFYRKRQIYKRKGQVLIYRRKKWPVSKGARSRVLGRSDQICLISIAPREDVGEVGLEMGDAGILGSPRGGGADRQEAW